jgi:hypothetical protein
MSDFRLPSESELVKVAYVEDSLEGQMIAGLLEFEGIDCLQLLGLQGTQIARPAALGERSSSGPRRIMVRLEDAGRAQKVLEIRRAEAETESGSSPRS